MEGARITECDSSALEAGSRAPALAHVTDSRSVSTDVTPRGGSAWRRGGANGPAELKKMQTFQGA
jgi:hypothetical protein